MTVSLRVTDDGGAPATTTRVIAVQAAPTAGQNLVVNPSFETSTANWILQTTSASAHALARAGNDGSLRVTDTAARRPPPPR